MSKELDEIYAFLLVRTAQQFKKFAHRELLNAGIDITSEQWVVLKRVHENEGINQKEIALLTYRDPASVTRTLDLLEKQGLLRRQVSEESRRSFSVYLTDEGNQLIQKIIPVAEEIRSKGLDGITEEEHLMFKKLVNKIYNNFQ